MEMLKRSFATILCLMLLFFYVPVSNAGNSTTLRPVMEIGGKSLLNKELLEAMVASEDVVPGKIVVKLSDTMAFSRSMTLKSMDAVQSFTTIGAGDVLEIDLNQAANMTDTIQAFSAMPGVEYVEPLYVYRATESMSQTVSQAVYEAVYLSNDTYAMKKWLWGLQAINITDTWERVSEEQRSNQIIAVLDTGVDLDHPDLQASLVEGYDFVSNDSFPDDDNGHGTHVAGIAAGIAGNGIGIAGVASGAKIMPVKVLDASGYGDSLDIYLGILFAVRQGADVINLSLGSSVPSLLLKEAIDYALAHDVVVVAASGNDYADVVGYPAAFDGVIAVGAVDWSYQEGFTRADFSNYGDKLDLVAPGVDIFSTVPPEKDIYDGKRDGYAMKQGTSMAAPFVAGMAALLRAEDNSLTYTQVQQRLYESAVDIGPAGWDKQYGMGIINGSNTKEVSSVIDFPHISVIPFGDQVSGQKLAVVAYRGKGVIDTGFSGEIAVSVDQVFSNPYLSYLYRYKSPTDSFFSLEKNEAGIQETIAQIQIVFDLINGSCIKPVTMDAGYYSFSFTDAALSEDYLLNGTNELFYIPGNKAVISGTLTLPEPSAGDMVIMLYAVNQIYSQVLMLDWEEPLSLNISAGQQTVPFSLELPPDRNYKLYYVIMTDNDLYQYYGFYKDTGTTLNPRDFTPIDLTTGDKTGVNLAIVKSTDQADDVSDTKLGATVLPVNDLAPDDIDGDIYSLEYKGDRDYFTFSVPSAGDYSFFLVSGNDCRETLYNSLGQVVDSSGFQLDVRLDPGTYYLKVEGETGMEVGPYILMYALNIPDTPQTPQLIQFADNHLKNAIYDYLGKDPGDPLYDNEVRFIWYLNLNDLSISSLDGLEYFTDLEVLELKGNQISDLTPLQGLEWLEILDLSDNAISDIQPLCSLTNLVELDLSNNNITVIPTEFSDLTGLYHLNLSDNAITSVSSLSSMQDMESLFLNGNMLSDINALVYMRRLKVLHLAGNSILDYSPIQSRYATLLNKDFSVPPVATDVMITGNETPGSVLTGTYTYSSMIGFSESGSSYRWLKSAQLNGVYTEIAGANSNTYTVNENDVGMYLKFEVIPRSEGEPEAGLPTLSPAFGPIRSGTIIPDDPGNGGNQGGDNSGGGNIGGGDPGDGDPIIPATPTPTISPTPTPTPTLRPSLTPTPTPTPVSRIEVDENGRTRLVVDVPDQGISSGKPPVIDATFRSGADGYTVILPASMFTGSQQQNQPVTVISNAFTFEIMPGTFDISARTRVVTLTADLFALEDLPDLILPADTEGVSFVFDFNVYIDDKPVTTFNQPITITVQADLSKVGNRDKVVMWYFSETDSKWIYIGGKVNEDGTITFTIPHFTKFTALEYTGTFADIGNHWAKEDIEIMAARQITYGTGNGKFSPNADISRAEFTAMIARALGITTGSGTNPFRDVKTGDWFLDAALKANAAGLIQGDANGNFSPHGMITREEMAAIAVRAYCYQTGTNPDSIITTQEVRFTDEDRAGSWARRSVVLADALGLMSGFPDGTFRPKNLSTRAEALVVIKRLMKQTGIF